MTVSGETSSFFLVDAKYRWRTYLQEAALGNRHKSGGFSLICFFRQHSGSSWRMPSSIFSSKPRPSANRDYRRKSTENLQKIYLTPAPSQENRWARRHTPQAWIPSPKTNQTSDHQVDLWSLKAECKHQKWKETKKKTKKKTQSNVNTHLSDTATWMALANIASVHDAHIALDVNVNQIFSAHSQHKQTVWPGNYRK